MAKLIITEPGWNGYTGDFGGVQFEGGTSVDDVPPFVAKRLAGLIRFTTSEGDCPSDAGALAAGRFDGAPVVKPMRTMEQVLAEQAALPAGDDTTVPAAQAQPEPAAQAPEPTVAEPTPADVQGDQVSDTAETVRALLEPLTAEAVTALASEKGIAGLRTAVAPINEADPAQDLKSNSIPGLVEKIAKARAEVCGEPETKEPAQPETKEGAE